MNIIRTIVLILLLCGCDSTPEKQTPKVFSLPEIPIAIVSPGERAQYLVSHYWDKFPFADTAYINLPNITEQAFVDYINLFPETSVEIVGQSIDTMINRSFRGSRDMYDYFFELYDKYLYDPNSPFRQEDYYIAFLRTVIALPQLGDIEKELPRYRLEMAMKNRSGNQAHDFEFERTDGRKMKLSEVKSEYVILFFNNPDCRDCLRVKDILSRISDPRITIVAIYPDEDLELWQKTSYPKGWVNGINSSIRKDNSYDLRAIPTLYLLNGDHKVVLKDAPVEQIIQFIDQNRSIN